MNQQGMLRWIEGAGWLVFAGPGGDIRAQALARAQSDGVVVYISFAEDRGDALMDDMEDLGAPAGYAVDLAIDRGVVLQQQLEDASLIVIESGSSLDALLETLAADVVPALRQAYERGSVILVEGVAMNAFGRWTVTDSGDAADGLAWVENVLLEPIVGADASPVIRDLLATVGDAIAIVIGEASALALGGDGRVEVWGQGRVTVSLGRQYSH